MRETGRNGYMGKVKKKIRKEFPQCEVRRLDPNEYQGSPDLLIMCPVTWATLEVKNSEKAKKQPNQENYVNKHDDMSFSSFIFPQNEKEVFNSLHRHIESFSKGERK